jgi:hypothetical protein
MDISDAFARNNIQYGSYKYISYDIKKHYLKVRSARFDNYIPRGLFSIEEHEIKQNINQLERGNILC